MNANQNSGAADSAKQQTQRPKLEIETVAALAATVLVGVWLFLAMVCAGPLWRDETNTLNVALMPLSELWKNLPFESFPPLFLLILRVWSFLGMAGNDAGIRLLSFFIGLLFLVSLWLCVRWIGGRAPTLTLALLGSLPAFIFTMSSNRAYGLAMCLLLLTFGTIWRVVEFPSKVRILAAGLTSLLFAHCLYYDVIFLGAILIGACLVVIRRRQWRILGALFGFGTLIGVTLLVYAPTLQSGSTHARVTRGPFTFEVLWIKLNDALSRRSSGQIPGCEISEVWLWLALIAVAILTALVMQYRRGKVSPRETGVAVNSNGADLALFSISSLLCGVAAYLFFLFRLKFPTQAWYYMGVLTLCAVTLEAVLNVSWRATRPWHFWRIALLVLLAAWTAPAMWREAHTRRTNVDLVAAVLKEKAKAGDFIVVHFAFEGITFERYYDGKAPWLTVPPIGSHKVHRSDLIWEKMHERNPMGPVLAEATKALRSGNSVWVAGRIPRVPQQLPAPRPPNSSDQRGWSLEEFGRHWASQLTAHLLSRATETRSFTDTSNVPVNFFENLPLLQFSGYKHSAEQTPVSQISGEQITRR
ncbi:MAG TPA: hypothetical protein VJA21_20340 [Verrucomicrobiae bacterium]